MEGLKTFFIRLLNLMDSIRLKELLILIPTKNRQQLQLIIVTLLMIKFNSWITRLILKL
jgi:hypothetical protein